eukprot:4187520-Pleurochrysis_carterae.AAC.1
MRSAQELCGAPNDLVRLRQFPVMLRRNVRKAHDVITVTDWRRPAIGGARGRIEAGYRESGARRRRKNGCVIAVGTALQQAF